MRGSFGEVVGERVPVRRLAADREQVAAVEGRGDQAVGADAQRSAAEARRLEGAVRGQARRDHDVDQWIGGDERSSSPTRGVGDGRPRARRCGARLAQERHRADGTGFPQVEAFDDASERGRMRHHSSVGRIWTFAAFLVLSCAACTSSGDGRRPTSPATPRRHRVGAAADHVGAGVEFAVVARSPDRPGRPSPPCRPMCPRPGRTPRPARSRRSCHSRRRSTRPTERRPSPSSSSRPSTGATPPPAAPTCATTSRILRRMPERLPSTR